jgi:fatty-acyl-CoA synthase
MLAPIRKGAGMGFLQYLRDDIVFLRGALRALKMTTPIAKHPTRVFPVVLNELSERYGDAPALISDRESFSYRSLGARANRYAIGPNTWRSGSASPASVGWSG